MGNLVGVTQNRRAGAGPLKRGTIDPHLGVISVNCKYHLIRLYLFLYKE